MFWKTCSGCKQILQTLQDWDRAWWKQAIFHKHGIGGNSFCNPVLMIVACLMCFSFLSRSFAIFDQPRSQSFSVSVLQTSFFDFANVRSFGSVGKIYHPRVPLTPPSINSVRSKPRSFHSLGSSTRFLVILFLSQLADAVNEHQLPLWVGGATKITNGWKLKIKVFGVLEKGHHLLPKPSLFGGLC